ncbi:MAG: class I SAM-dependent methyltransferase [Bacillota bacterium]
MKGPRVLELGCGTGANVPHWGAGLRVTALDRSPHMLEHAQRKAAGLARPAEFVQACAESLPFEAAQFDDVVTTFVLCSVQGPAAMLSEIHRVLRAGGTLHMLEHLRSRGRAGRVMDCIAGPLYQLTGDHIARDPAPLLAQAGFSHSGTAQFPLLLDIVRIIRATKR